MLSGDEILKGDVKYILVGDKPSEPYLVYPGKDSPRFLIPTKDTTAQKFILRMMSANQGMLGYMIRTLLLVPGGVFFLQKLVFRNRVLSNHD